MTETYDWTKTVTARKNNILKAMELLEGGHRTHAKDILQEVLRKLYPEAFQEEKKELEVSELDVLINDYSVHESTLKNRNIFKQRIISLAKRKVCEHLSYKSDQPPACEGITEM